MQRRTAPLIAVRVAAVAVALAVVLGAAGRAEARAVHYRSQHPLPRKIGHGFCYIGVPHVHDFGPSDPRLYRELGGELYFVGDPAPFAYEGPRYSFYGPHPVVEADVQLGQPVYCYLNGPHYHWYQPGAAVSAQFEFRGGAYWYVGNYDPVYYQDRPRYVGVNEVYQPIAYERPVVDVTVAPPSFHGEIVVGPGYRRAQAVVAPPVVSAGVTFAVPPPPQIQVGVGIGIGVGGPPVVVEDRRTVYEVHEHEHEHHDHGHHNGWDKHGHEGEGWRGGPPGPPPRQAGAWRGGPAPAPAPAPAPRSTGWRGAPVQPAPASGGWRGSPPPPPAAPHKDRTPSHGGGSWHR